jgi:hypothetical protein
VRSVAIEVVLSSESTVGYRVLRFEVMHCATSCAVATVCDDGTVRSALLFELDVIDTHVLWIQEV